MVENINLELIFIYITFLLQLMECGAHGALGQLVVKHVDTAPGREHVTVIILNRRTMGNPARELDFRNEDAMLIILAQVS